MLRRSRWQSWSTVVLVLCSVAARSWAQSASSLSSELRQHIDQLVARTLNSTGVPSASLAVVKDSEISYLHAYGSANLDPPIPARPEMRYCIGSISKQFTATAVLMLAEENKLSLSAKAAMMSEIGINVNLCGDCDLKTE